MTQKIVAGEGNRDLTNQPHTAREFTGLDLKVGGEVMAGFYENRRDFSLEDLYLAFKARLQQEIMVDRYIFLSFIL